LGFFSDGSLGGFLASLGLFLAATYLYFFAFKHPRIQRFVYEDYPELIPASVRTQIDGLLEQFPDIWVECVGYLKDKKLAGLAYIQVHTENQQVMFYLHPDLCEGPYEMAL
tara:strand:+ start:1135 stop:1467 length:333 start_codon:yes stop_codon:yes gene_type:complete